MQPNILLHTYRNIKNVIWYMTAVIVRYWPNIKLLVAMLVLLYVRCTCTKSTSACILIHTALGF